MPSGTIDLEEDFDHSYGGPKSCEVLETSGITALFPALFPKKEGSTDAKVTT